MGKMLDKDVLVAHLERMMQARQIDRLPKSGYAKAIQDIDGCPTVDAVQVVRCRDCEHSYYASNRVTGEQCFACWLRGIDVSEDWFCVDGELRCENG